MIRRPTRSLASFALVAVLAACGGGPTSPILTDPTEIVTAALKSTEAATSVHLEVAVDGVVPVALPGSGTATEVNLTGTTATADADLANGEARLTFSVPAVLGLAGELIQADGTTYLKTTLTGSKFEVVESGSLPVDPSNTDGLVDALGDFLLKPGMDPVKGDDVACGGSQCYTVVVDLTAEELSALLGDGAMGLPVDVTGAAIKVTARVEQDEPNHLAGVAIEITRPDAEPLTVDLTFSKWNESVTITAPPADQVDAG